MTVGKKIQQLRLKQNLTQAQLADQLCVSRAAVAKWENGNGLPDIGNLQMLSNYFHIDIDTLLDETKSLELSEITESVSLNNYVITDRCRSAYDAVVLNKFSDACCIRPVILLYDFNKAERIVNVLTFGLLKAIWQLTHWKEYTGHYYFVATFTQQYLVSFSQSKMVTTPLSYRTRNIMREFYVNNKKFLILKYDILNGQTDT